jgi:putative solute:sodium symporter small subunit
MSDTDTASEESSHELETDGGVAAEEADVNYLETEINLLSPSTPFMRDHLKVVWGTFAAWVLIVWGPLIATWLAPETMTQTIPGGFPLHYFLIALGAPTGALILAGIYARQRDKLDEKYGIDPSSVESDSGSGASEEATATDGGIEE